MQVPVEVLAMDSVILNPAIVEKEYILDEKNTIRSMK